MNEYWIWRRVKNLIEDDTNEEDDAVKGLIKNNIIERYKKIYKRDPTTSLLLQKSNETLDETLDENDKLFEKIYEKYIVDIKKIIEKGENFDPQEPQLPFDHYETYLKDKIGVEMITYLMTDDTITKEEQSRYDNLLKSYKNRLNNDSSKEIEQELGILTTQNGGGNANITKKSKKSILGKERCIYKKAGDRKEYLRYKGDLITVKDYTKLMKAKAAKD